MCDEGKEKREVLKTSLFFFSGEYLPRRFRGCSRQMKKHQFPEEFLCKLKKKKKEKTNDTENGLSRNGINNNDDAHTFYYSLYYYY